ncbi:hypothetical protein WDZ11_22300 (plasmid) [Roseomonas mucosa]|uniref:hypothetical protein n=1 Tax=Roseomonas mucosa TaxID=207340 RepID=UPI0030D60D55
MPPNPTPLPRSAAAGCLAQFRLWQVEAERLREGAGAAPLNTGQSARLLRDAHTADRRVTDWRAALADR